MKFRDLFRPSKQKQVGRVIEAKWDSEVGGIRFRILFEPSGRRIGGICRAGADPVSGRFTSELELRSRLPKFKEMKVFESSIGGDPNTMSAEEFAKMKIEINLSDSSIGYQTGSPKPDINSFISKSFR